MRNLPISKLTKKQIKIFTKNNVIVCGEKADIIAKVRYDDECGNGHNTFAITAEIYKAGKRGDRNWIAGGCYHDEIAKHFPELAPFIKWHLTSSDGPMHYIANTTYHARTVDTKGKNVGDVTKVKRYLKFTGCPFTFNQQEKGFWDYLDSITDFNSIEVEPIKYDGTSDYDFNDNYSLTGFIKENESKKWYKAPFKDKKDADEFLEALKTLKYEYIEIPIAWAKAVEPNIEAARRCAIWPDATLEQLRDEKLLADRLPALMQEFKKDVESLGFEY